MLGRLSLSTLLVLVALPCSAEPTRVMVRARAMDAKFIGDHTGGVKVTLRDAGTERVLTQGFIRGGTGDTARIMKTSPTRYGQLSDDPTAGFAAIVDISEPTLVRIEAEGPLGKPASASTVSSTLWILPGRNVDGDGVVLTFPGLIVEPTATLDPSRQIRLSAKVSPMCGCPIDAGGLWDAANYSVRATLLRKNRPIAETTLQFTGKTGEYAGALPKPSDGSYSVRFVAVDSKTPNTGVVAQPLTIPR